MCNQQGAGEHGAPSHYLYQENNSVPGTRPGCLLVGGVGRWGGRDEAESGGLDCHPGGSNPRSKVQPSDHLPALVSLPTPTRGGARSKRCNPEEPEPCASEPRKRGARRGVLSTRHPPGDCTRGRQPTPGTRLARGRRARAAQRRLVPVGRCHRRADPAPHLEAGARLGSASAQPRKRRPPGPPRCSAPRPGASSRAPGAGIRGRRGRPELSGGGGRAGRPGSAALLRG